MLADDGASGGRAVTEFRLFYFDTASASFQPLDTYIPPTHPYGNNTSSQNLLDVTRTLASPVTAKKFRAEFVQYAGPPYGGVRVVELDAISPQAVPPASSTTWMGGTGF